MLENLKGPFESLPVLKVKYSTVFIKVVPITVWALLSLILLAAVLSYLVKIDIVIETAGKLEPVISANIYSPLGSKIKKVHFKEGKLFKKGQVLVELESAKSLAELAKLENEISILKFRYHEKKELIPYDSERSDVETNKAKAQVLSAMANFRRVVLDYFPDANVDSLRNHYSEGSHIALDFAYSQLTSAEANLKYTNTDRKIRALNTELELKTILSNMHQKEGEIKELNHSLNSTMITAPFDGMIVTSDIASFVDKIYNEGSLLFRIIKIDEWKACFYFSEKDLFKVAVGDSVQMEISVLTNSEQQTTISGMISSISPQPNKLNFYEAFAKINFQPGTLIIKNLKSGFSITGRVIKGKERIIYMMFNKIKDIL